MPAYYLETSGLLKRYKTERGTDTVAELFDGKLTDERFLTTYFTTVEMEAVAARALRGNILTQAAYDTMLNWFAADVAAAIDLLPVTHGLLLEAGSVARTYGLRAPDAIHLASARAARAAGERGLRFVGSDRELGEATRRGGFALLDPEDAASLTTLRQYRR